jgi:predicted amidohydrolase
MWELMGEAVSFFSTAFVLYCNRVGLEDGVSFAGGSFVYGPRGNQMNRASYGDPEMLIQDLDPSAIRETRKTWPFKRDDKPEVILQSLARIVRAYED